MSQYPSRPVGLQYGTDDRAVFNFFNAVYAWMAVGLAVTASVAWFVSQNVGTLGIFRSPGVAIAFMLGSVLLCWGIRGAAMRLRTGVALSLFILYSALIGIVFSSVFLVYRLDSIAGVFIITAGTFGAMSVYGYVTKKDLTSLGSFLFMALWGIFLASIVNIFMASAPLYWLINYVGLAVFILLVAYDTQKLKEIAYQTQGNAVLASRLAVIGSLELYLDFINIFLFLLRIMGRRR